VTRPITRRQFLAGTAAAGAAGAIGYATASLLAPSSTSAEPGRGTLVLCTLYGGNDGLNTVIPYQDPNYLGQRGTLAYQPNEVIPLADGLALHPSLAGTKKLWDARQLAIVRGVGYPNPSFSHFRSMDIWQSGVPDTDSPTGWLGRWLDATTTDPLEALSLGPTVPLATTGAKVIGAALPAGSLALPGTAAAQAAYASLQTPYRGEPALAAAAARSGASMLRVRQSLGSVLGPPAPGGGASASFGAGDLASQLDVVARLIRAGAPPRVYCVSLSGFDTHADEKATQARLLAELDGALSGFAREMAADPRGAGTVTVVYTEFGRRVAANASGGTDHGSAGPVLVLGRAVKGGFYGEEPSLASLDMGNLRYTTDFRSVYATVLDRVLGTDPRVALGRPWPGLGFL
jgi:uncharacterized protein (DUF1501 family)